MNILIEKTFAFSAVLVIPEQTPFINEYEVKLRLHVQGQNNKYNIAYRRMQHWFYEIMHQSTLIEFCDPRAKIWRETGMRCIEFPTAPCDQVLGMMLMSKLEAITEQYMTVLQVTLCSPADDFISYICDHGDHLSWFEKSGWWQHNGPGYSDEVQHPRRSDKVISLSRAQDWKQYNLDWHAHDDNSDHVADLTIFDQDAQNPPR